MDLLVTLDQCYITQLRVMLTSLYLNHTREPCRIYLLHSSIPDGELKKLEAGMASLGFSLLPVLVNLNLNISKL